MSRVTSSAAAVFPHASPHAATPDRPLTGRGAELSILSSALQTADSGSGGTVFIAGESGIGKTRLAVALVEQAIKRDFNIAVGRAYPVEAGVPYAVFADALLPLLRALEPSTLSLLTRGGNAELVQLFPALARSPVAVAQHGSLARRASRSARHARRPARRRIDAGIGAAGTR